MGVAALHMSSALRPCKGPLAAVTKARDWPALKGPVSAGPLLLLRLDHPFPLPYTPLVWGILPVGRDSFWPNRWPSSISVAVGSRR